MTDKYLNGRVNIKTTDTNALFSMYDRIPAHQCVSFRNPTEGLWEDTQLSKLFFGENNINNLQKQIQLGVLNLSKGQYHIGYQDCDTLKVIMRSTFLQYSSNMKKNINEQVSNLNKMVLDYCIPQVYSEAQGYLKYIDDASTLVVPIAHPTYSSTDKTLEFKTWFGN